MDTNGNYIQNQFCSYKIALKLKELGFNEKCLASYYTDDERNYGKGDIYDCRRKLSSSIDFDPFKEEFDNFYINSNETYYVSAPLWQQVIDWFKEKHNMYIEITYEGGLQKDTSLYSFQIWSNQTSNKSDKMNYYKCREKAILKAIELCQKER